MASFFSLSNSKYKIQPSVAEYIEILSVVNQRSLELESLQLARRHNAHKSHIVSEQVNSLLAKQAGIQTKITSLSKKSEYHMAYWVNVLHKHQFFRLNLLMFLHNTHQYQKKLSQLDEMKLALLQDSPTEKYSVDNFLFKLREVIQRQLTLAKMTSDIHFQERLYQDVASMQQLIYDFQECVDDSRALIFRGIQLIQKQLNLTLNYREFLGCMVAENQYALYRVDWIIGHTILELRKGYLNYEKQRALLQELQRQLSHNTQKSNERFKHLLSLFRERTRLDSIITQLRQQQEKDKSSLRIYQKTLDNKPEIQRFLEINQLITIQDVLINTSKIAGLTHHQLNEKLKKIVDIAVSYHMPLMDEQGIKKGFENHVTRLITNEFSFYTKKPLTLGEYQQVLKAIELLAKKLPPNIQLLLSSFAVVDSKGRLANVVLHVCSGKDVVIRQGVKSFPANNDPDYGLTKLSVKKHKDVPYRMTMKRVNSSMPVTFNYSHLVLSQTQGGAQLLTSLEICLDVKFLCAERCLIDTLEKSKGYYDYPLQYSHVISSHTYPPISLSANIPKLVQADKKYFGRWYLSQYRQMIPSSAMRDIKKVPLSNNNFAMVYHYPFTPAGLVPKKYRQQMTSQLMLEKKQPLVHSVL